MPGEAVDEVVLAAVGLVRDDDDVAAVGEQRMSVALLLGKELLNRREDHAARGDLQQLAKVGAALGLDRASAQQFRAAGERAEQLVVEVVAVGEDDQCRILHAGCRIDRPGVEGHREALARPCVCQTTPDAPVALAGETP